MSDFASQLALTAPRLRELIAGFEQQTILVIGDLALDELLTGAVERISREAPVLILRHEHTKQTPGGGANAVYNLAKLGAEVKVVGLVGKDAQGDALQEIFTTAGIDIQGIVTTPDRPTVTKTRIAGHSRQSVTQQIVRIDRKSDLSLPVDLQLTLADYIEQNLDVDGVVCSDYGDGVFTDPVIKAALKHSRVIVDAQKDLHRYQGASIFTPNLPEAEQAVGYTIQDDATLALAGQDLLKLTQGQNILVTRGEEGMSIFTDSDRYHIPAFNRTDVFDVTGAGDTVVAALTLALGAGGTIWEAAVLGNLAASIVVRQFGTATTNIAEMKEALNQLLDNNYVW